MFKVGDKIIYGECGVCTVDEIAPLESAPADKMYYRLSPYIGSGTYFTPVDSNAYMRHVMTREEAEALIDAIPGIEPAICTDNRFNHVDTFYRNLFKQHTCEALVSVVKGLKLRMAERKTKSSRTELTLRRAKDILHGELSVALGIELDEVENYIMSRISGK